MCYFPRVVGQCCCVLVVFSMLLCICLFLHAAANWLFLYVIAYVVSSKYLCSFFVSFLHYTFSRAFLGVADNALFFPCCDVYVVFSVLVFRSVAVHVFFVKLYIILCNIILKQIQIIWKNM